MSQKLVLGLKRYFGYLLKLTKSHKTSLYDPIMNTWSLVPEFLYLTPGVGSGFYPFPIFSNTTGCGGLKVC